MKTAIKALAALVALGLLALGAYRGYDIIKLKKEQPRKKQEEKIPVSIVKVVYDDIREVVSLSGSIEPFSKVDIFCKVPGRLEVLSVEEGDSVEKGQEIAVVEHAAIEAAVEQAEAALKVADAQLKQVRTNLAITKKDRDRIENLHKEGAASKQKFDQIQAQYESLLAQEELALAQIDQMKANLRLARIQLDETSIKAPIRGVISQKYLCQGDMAVKSAPIVSIVDIDTVKILAGVSEKDMTRIIPGKTTARVVVDAYLDDPPFEGKVSRISPTVDPHTRTAEVEIWVDNPGHRLKPGMFARVAIVLSCRQDVTVIPSDVIMREGSECYVFKVKEGRAKKVLVKIGLQEGNLVEVLDGIQPGDSIIRGAGTDIADNSLVEIATEGE